jgi:hypothetical protein
MRRFLLAAAATAAIGSLAAPGVSAGQVPAQDSVTGFAATGLGRLAVDFTFDAHSGPSGENPGGTVRFDALLIDLGNLPVACLNVSGNLASMIALISVPSPAAPDGVLILVEDNDGAGQDDVAWTFLETVPTGCPVPIGVDNPIRSGDVTVTDAPKLPSSKDQCKDGGWKTYGLFKNQGDCVSFVATKERNLPPDGS